MKLIKAKSTKRFGGKPYLTIPRGAEMEHETPSQEVTTDNVVEYLVNENESDVPEDYKTLEEVPDFSIENLTNGNNGDATFKMTWGQWIQCVAEKTSSTTFLVVSGLFSNEVANFRANIQILGTVDDWEYLIVNVGYAGWETL